MLELDAGDTFVVDVPRAARHAGVTPLFVLHGFPTCSLRLALGAPGARHRPPRRAVRLLRLRALRQTRRALLIRRYADQAEEVARALGLDRVVLVTHDMGDTVGGELLARDLEGDARPRDRMAGADERQHLHRDGAPHGRASSSCWRSTTRVPTSRDAATIPARPSSRPRRRRSRPRTSRPTEELEAQWAVRRAPRRPHAAAAHHPLHRGPPRRSRTASPARSNGIRRRSASCGASSIRSRWPA